MLILPHNEIHFDYLYTTKKLVMSSLREQLLKWGIDSYSNIADLPLNT